MFIFARVGIIDFGTERLISTLGSDQYVLVLRSIAAVTVIVNIIVLGFRLKRR